MREQCILPFDFADVHMLTKKIFCLESSNFWEKCTLCHTFYRLTFMMAHHSILLSISSSSIAFNVESMSNFFFATKFFWVFDWFKFSFEFDYQMCKFVNFPIVFYFLLQVQYAVNSQKAFELQSNHEKLIKTKTKRKFVNTMMMFDEQGKIEILRNRQWCRWLKMYDAQHFGETIKNMFWKYSMFTCNAFCTYVHPINEFILLFCIQFASFAWNAFYLISAVWIQHVNVKIAMWIWAMTMSLMVFRNSLFALRC